MGRETGRKERNAGRRVEWRWGRALKVLSSCRPSRPPSEPLLDDTAQQWCWHLHLPLPGLSSRSMGSVGMDGCPGPAEFTACTWNT